LYRCRVMIQLRLVPQILQRDDFRLVSPRFLLRAARHPRQKNRRADSTQNHPRLLHAFSSFRVAAFPIVALWMSGRAQNPVLSTIPNVTYRKAIPVRNPPRSPILPITTGTTAAPMIPVFRIPENDP